jgi:hypothetical protein
MSRRDVSREGKGKSRVAGHVDWRRIKKTLRSKSIHSSTRFKVDRNVSIQDPPVLFSLKELSAPITLGDPEQGLTDDKPNIQPK